MEREIETEVLTRLTRIETKLDDYIEKRIAEIEEKLKWISRTVAGAVIAGAISMIFAIIKLSL